MERTPPPRTNPTQSTSDSRRKWLTLLTVSIGLLMIVLDSNVVNLAIPKILHDFGATLPQMQWVNNAYLLTFAIFLITFGRLGDQIGRKKMFITGIIVFVTGSLLAGVAANSAQLIGFRIFQGIGSAAMMPATLSLISANFEKRERGIAMGIWGAVAGVSIALGPILGGLLTESGLGASLNAFFHVSQLWRYVFFLNLPIGILAILMAVFIVRESRDSESTHRYDVPGIVLATLAVFALTYAFIDGPDLGWWHTKQQLSIAGLAIHVGSLSIIPFLFALAVLFGWLFLRRERRVRIDPLVDVKLFRNRNFWVGNVGTAVLAFGMLGSFFLLPLFLESVLGFSPKHAGLSLLPLALAMMVSAPVAGKLSDRIGAKWGITFGMAMMGIGLYLMAHFSLDTTIRSMFTPFLVTGIGMGFAIAPITSISLLDIPPDEAGGASGVLTTARQIGSVMGIAILGAYLQSALPANLETHINAIRGLPDQAKVEIVTMAKSGGLTQESIDPSKLQAAITPLLTQTASTSRAPSAPSPLQLAQSKQLGNDIVTASRQGFTDAINQTLKISTIIAAFGAFISLLFQNRRPTKDRAPSSTAVVADTGSTVPY